MRSVPSRDDPLKRQRSTEEASAVGVRAYRQPFDAAATHAVYQAAITITASADYEPHQIAAWAGSEDVDLNQWDSRRQAAHTFVAVTSKQIIGFADFLDEGLLDMLFVHPDFGRRGVARLLVDRVKREAAEAGLTTLRAHASRTARPALEQLGFWVHALRPDNTVGGLIVPNFEMQCLLDSASRPE